MTVQELKELLNEAPNDMLVFIGSSTELGMFCFMPACAEDSGVIEFGPEEGEATGNTETGKGFVLFPHGLVQIKGEESKEDYFPQLN